MCKRVVVVGNISWVGAFFSIKDFLEKHNYPKKLNVQNIPQLKGIK